MLQSRTPVGLPGQGLGPAPFLPPNCIVKNYSLKFHYNDRNCHVVRAGNNENRFESLIAASAVALLVEASSPWQLSSLGFAPKAAAAAEIDGDGTAALVVRRAAAEAPDSVAPPHHAVAPEAGRHVAGAHGGFWGGVFGKSVPPTHQLPPGSPLVDPEDDGEDDEDGEEEEVAATSHAAAEGGGGLLQWVMAAVGGVAGGMGISRGLPGSRASSPSKAAGKAVKPPVPLAAAPSASAASAAVTPPSQQVSAEEHHAAGMYGGLDGDEYPYDEEYRRRWEEALWAKSGGPPPRGRGSAAAQWPPPAPGSAAAGGAPSGRRPPRTGPGAAQSGRGPRGPTGHASPAIGDPAGAAAGADFDAYPPHPRPYYGPPPPWWREPYAEYDRYGAPYGPPPPPLPYHAYGWEEPVADGEEAGPGPAPHDPYSYYYSTYWSWDAARRWDPRPPYDSPYDGSYTGYDPAQLPPPPAGRGFAGMRANPGGRLGRNPWGRDGERDVAPSSVAAAAGTAGSRPPVAPRVGPHVPTDPYAATLAAGPARGNVAVPLTAKVPPSELPAAATQHSALTVGEELLDLSGMDEALAQLQEHIDQLQVTGSGGEDGAFGLEAERVEALQAPARRLRPRVTAMRGWRQQLQQEEEEGQQQQQSELLQVIAEGERSQQQRGLKAAVSATTAAKVDEVLTGQQHQHPQLHYERPEQPQLRLQQHSAAGGPPIATGDEYERLLRMWREAHPEEAEDVAAGVAAPPTAAAAADHGAHVEEEEDRPPALPSQQQERPVSVAPDQPRRQQQRSSGASSALPQPPPVIRSAALAYGRRGSAQTSTLEPPIVEVDATAARERHGADGASAAVAWVGRVTEGDNDAGFGSVGAQPSGLVAVTEQEAQLSVRRSDQSNEEARHKAEQVEQQQQPEEQAQQRRRREAEAAEQAQAGAELAAAVQEALGSLPTDPQHHHHYQHHSHDTQQEHQIQFQHSQQQHNEQSSPAPLAAAPEPTAGPATAPAAAAPAGRSSILAARATSPSQLRSVAAGGLSFPRSVSPSSLSSPSLVLPSKETILQLKATSAAAADRAAETLARIRAMRAAAEAAGPRSGSGGRAYVSIHGNGGAAAAANGDLGVRAGNGGGGNAAAAAVVAKGPSSVGGGGSSSSPSPLPPGREGALAAEIAVSQSVRSDITTTAPEAQRAMSGVLGREPAAAAEVREAEAAGAL